MNKVFSSSIKSENAKGFVAVIPDIKCVSPKEGDLLRGRDPVTASAQLCRSGAPVMSVVTEPERFGGNLELLRSIVRATGVPVLRKDFITSKEALGETAHAGAAAVLLISAIMGQNKLGELFDKSLALGLEPFVEVCNEDEMSFAKSLGAKLIGINNKDITTLELDNGGVSRTSQLATGAPKDAVLVSESGIFTAEDARAAADAGANAVLVGTALWQAEDIIEKYQSLRIPI